jgi:tyrosine-protein phosphatase SIW14
MPEFEALAIVNIQLSGVDMTRTHRTVLQCVLAAAVLFSVPPSVWSQSNSQTVTRAKGIPNWGQVTDTLYRGGQPVAAGFKSLQQLGVGIVVDFRDEPEEIASERREVEGLGVRYVSIPWSGNRYPSNPQVVEFLDLVRANPQTKIFVHCKRGADRTGVMIAAYRIAVEHKTAADAVAEMHQYHYDHFWLPQLERYVRTLPQTLTGDPLFGSYAPRASIPSAAPGVSPAGSEPRAQ